MKVKGLVVATILGTLLVASFACKEGTELASPTPKASTEFALVDYDIHLYDVGVDKLYIDEANILLRNDGVVSATISELVLSSSGEETRGSTFVTLEPGEEQEISCRGSLSSHELSKPIGVDQITVTMTILGYPEGETDDQILAEEDISIPIPRIGIEGSIPELQGTQNLSLTLLSWEESNIAVDGPYSSDYYTFTARPNMKFVILVYKFQNNDIRAQETPYISAGEIATDKGYIYSIWHPPLGVESTEYNPRKATNEEVDKLIGDSGGFEDLLQEESTIGCVVFEIPADATPVEASLAYVPVLIKF